MRSLILASALLLSPLALGAEPASDSQPAKRLLNEVQTAFNTHDANKLAKTMAPDATVIAPDGKRMHGTEQIKSTMTEQMKKDFEGSHSTFTLDGIRPVGPTAMWVDATQHLTNLKKPDGSRGSQTMHLAALIEKKGDHWVAVEVRPYAFLPSSGQGVGGSGTK